MAIFIQQLINGLTLGSIYGLIAIGYTMVFGIIGMVNFAHGDVFMVSAFIALLLLMITFFDPVVVHPVAMFICQTVPVPDTLVTVPVVLAIHEGAAAPLDWRI